MIFDFSTTKFTSYSLDGSTIIIVEYKGSLGIPNISVYPFDDSKDVNVPFLLNSTSLFSKNFTLYPLSDTSSSIKSLLANTTENNIIQNIKIVPPVLLLITKYKNLYN